MKQKLRKNKVLVLAALAVVLVGGLVWFGLSRHKSSTLSPAGSSSPQTSNGINYGPATQTEKQDSQNAKNQAVQQDSQPSSSSSGKKQVSVSVIYADRNSVRAQVTGVFENGGTCTAKATSPSEATVTKTSTGVGNVSYTNCGLITWSLSGAGPWTVTVSYDSATASGTSGSYTVN